MKLFEVQTHSVLYIYPVTKIILSLSVILVCLFRNKLFNISEGLQSVFFSVLSFALVIPCVLIIYLSIGELFHIHSNRQHRIPVIDDTVAVPVDEVVAMTKRDSIVEIEILYRSEIIKIGSSADNAFSSTVFRDKRFYIDSREFESAEIFSAELMSRSESGLLYVLTIDGLSAKSFQ